MQSQKVELRKVTDLSETHMSEKQDEIYELPEIGSLHLNKIDVFRRNKGPSLLVKKPPKAIRLSNKAELPKYEIYTSPQQSV